MKTLLLMVLWSHFFIKQHLFLLPKNNYLFLISQGRKVFSGQQITALCAHSEIAYIARNTRKPLGGKTQNNTTNHFARIFFSTSKCSVCAAALRINKILSKKHEHKVL